jgi:hypothetical protein
MKRLFVDLDGTAAEWRMAASNEELYESGYFASLAPNIEVCNAVKRLATTPNVEVYIISAVNNSIYTIRDKNIWVDTHLSKYIPRIYVPYGERKSRYVPGGIRKNDVLLDDYTKNLIEWRDSGGTALKVLNGINNTNGTWTGAKCRYDSANNILTEICSLWSDAEASETTNSGINFNTEFYGSFHILDAPLSNIL